MTNNSASPQQDELLTPGEVAKLFKVDPKTVSRWAHAGKLSSVTTPGGHKRFRRSEVQWYLEGGKKKTAS